MAWLVGAHAPISAVVTALTHNHRADPFGDNAPSNRDDTVATTIREIVRLLNRLMAILEGVQQSARPEPPDDFMRGWGEPGGDIEA